MLFELINGVPVIFIGTVTTLDALYELTAITLTSLFIDTPNVVPKYRRAPVWVIERYSELRSLELFTIHVIGPVLFKTTLDCMNGYANIS
jgi:hypothetical protein